MIKIVELNGIVLSTPLVATDGGVITRNYNETLDNATIRIPHLTSKIDIKPFYNVKLEYGNLTKYMCVDSYVCTEDNIDSGFKTYTYEIKLFSEVKKLERVILPNLSITPRKIGNKLKIYDYIKQYMDEYCPKHIVSGQKVERKIINKEFTFAIESYEEYPFVISKIVNNHEIYSAESAEITEITCVGGIVENSELRVVYDHTDEIKYCIHVDATGSQIFAKVKITLYKNALDTSNHLENDYTLKVGYINKFNKDCPEMQWTNPNLRDVLNDLMMLNDCVLTMENNVIGWLDLTEVKNPITQYNYIQESQGSDDFETDLRMELKNVMQTSISGINNSVRTLERIMFKPDNFVLTSDNVLLKTQFPIMDIISFKMHIFPVYATPSTYTSEKVDHNVEYEYDITSFIKEIREYNTLKTLYRSNISIDDVDSENDEYYAQYQNFNVYYTRLSNTIEGWGKLTKSNLLEVFQSYMTLEWLKAIVYGHFKTTKPSSQVIDSCGSINQGVNSYASVYFDIEYTTTASCVFESGKAKASGFKSVISDNQTNAWADAYSVGRLEYQKANRMGNKNFMINQRITEDTTPIDIGDYLGDKIAYQVQYQSYIDHEEVNAYCVEGYILQNYFTGIKSKVRTWVNAKEEAFERHDLKKFYCEFSKNAKTEVLDIDNNNIGSYLLSPLSQVGNPIKVVGITSDATSNWYNVGCLTRLIGKSMVFTTGFTDNGFVDKYIDLDALNSATSNQPIIDGEINLGIMTPMRIQYKLNDLSDYLGGIPYSQYSYVNSNYECNKFYVVFGTSYFYINLTTNMALRQAMSFPLVEKDYINIANGGFQLDYVSHKDNKEIPMISLQYEFCSDTNDIEVYDEWLKYERAISTNTGNVSIKDSNGTVQALTFNISQNGSYGLIHINETITQDKDYYFYVGTDKVLKFKNTQNIYLNIRRSR